MVKVEYVECKDGISKLYFEARQNEDGIEELDNVYAALLGSEPKRGGYTSSYGFVIEVKRDSGE